MLPLEPCFMPYRNSMARFDKMSREEQWQEKEQTADKMVIPYDIFEQGLKKKKPLPKTPRLTYQ